MQAIFQNFGIYVHVPFCAKSCGYCRFYKRSPAAGDMDAYALAVGNELDLLRRENGGNVPRPDTMFWGGGTPSSLSERHIERLAKILEPVLPKKEWTAEVSPTGLSAAKLALLKGVGVTRISMGVQSFSEKTLNTLGRAHSLKATMDAIEKIDAAAFENFSIDLIFGSPGQTMDEWEFDIKKAASMPVNHISAYCLEFESGTSCCAGRAAESEYAKREREGDFLETAMELLPSLGFKQYEISNYSKPGGECLHNLSTWNMAEWIGLGPSAASQWRGLRRRNAPSFEEWQKGILNGSPSYEDVVELDDEEMFSSALIFGLRMNAGVDMAEISARFPKADAAKYADTLEFLRTQGLLEFRGNIVRLTKEGRLVADSVAVELL